MCLRSTSRSIAFMSIVLPVLCFVSGASAWPARREGDDPANQAPRTQRQTPQPSAIEVPPHPIDLAPKAKQDPALAQCLELRAWADKEKFQQAEPVEIHYVYYNRSKDQELIASGTPDGAHSLEVEVTCGDALMPRTRYACQPRLWPVQQARGVEPFQIHPQPDWPGPSRRRPLPDFAIKGTIPVNLLRDMTSPGRYIVTLVMPVYSPDLTAKAEARSRPIIIDVVKRPET